MFVQFFLALLAPALAGSSPDIHMRNSEGQQVLNQILTDSSFWQGASRKQYQGRSYDEIRLKDTDSGYVPMISGEGAQDFDNAVVADVVYKRNTDLPKYMSGAKVVIPLGSGYDSTVGADYRDSYYILDLTAFYGHFPQRMYRRFDETEQQWVMWFEKLGPGFVDAATWSKYQAKMTSAVEGLDKRWLLNAVVEVTDIYGMFLVEPGEEHRSRVTFISKVTFGQGSGFIARVGSQMPGVLKAGLKSGFSASVAIAAHETTRRKPAPPAPVVPAPAPVVVPPAAPAPAAPPPQ